ncbi:hypothetical protein Ddc_07986 [Ditylenchus destructor]|nr:hypothetical protein Ddc_07986 [Ditylenchus destructor]
MEYVNKAIQIPTRAYSSTWAAAASPFVSLVASIFCCCSGPISSYSCSAAADLHLLLLAISNRQKPCSFAVESSNNSCVAVAGSRYARTPEWASFSTLLVFPAAEILLIMGWQLRVCSSGSSNDIDPRRSKKGRCGPGLLSSGGVPSLEQWVKKKPLIWTL